MWCASPKTTAQETPAATVNLLPDLFILLSVDILLGGSRRDQILSSKSGITFPSQEKRTDPFPAPRRLAFSARSASLGQKKLPASCQKRDLGVKKPAGCLELRTAWVRQAGSPVGGARSAGHGVSRGGAQGSLWRCSGSVALRPSPPATDRSRVPCFGRRILSQEVPELL